MKKNKCIVCGHSWLVTQGKNGHPLQQVCPRCESNRIVFVGNSLIHNLGVGGYLTDFSLSNFPSSFVNKHAYQGWMVD